MLGAYTGASFINTDAEGNIFVSDSAKGLHQFQDAGRGAGAFYMGSLRVRYSRRSLPDPPSSGLVNRTG